MTRTADHDARRGQISQAAIDIALTDGLSRVTVARVASMAGVSVGLVQHYFSSKQALMARVYDDLLARADERVTDVVDSGEAAGRSIREMVADAVCELLPLDEERRAECLARIELETIAARDPQLRHVAERRSRSLVARLAAVVDNAKRCGESPDRTDSDRAAALVWATATGVARVRLIDPDFPCREILADTAVQVFPHRCRHHG